MNLKNKIIFSILFLFGLIFFILYITQRGSLIFEKFNLEKTRKNNSRIVQYLNMKLDIEGKYIWDINLLNKKSFESTYINKSIKIPKIFFWFDTSGCEQCYIFHMRSIKKLIGKKNTIIIYNNKFKYLKVDFRGYYFLNNTGENKNFKDIVMLINSEGQILYVDFPTSGLYDLSRKFYKIVSGYTRK